MDQFKKIRNSLVPKISAIFITREKHFELPKQDFVFDEIIVETGCSSILRRYELALQARNEVIYFQDDDCEIDILTLWKHYNGTITNSITEHHAKYYSGTGITLLGWGAFFPKKLINFNKYLEKYGRDFYLEREADRIFTYLNQPHNSVMIDIRHISRESRMSDDPNHYHYLSETINRLKQL